MDAEEAEFVVISENFSAESSQDNVTIDSFYFYKVEQFTVLWILFVVIVAGNMGVLYTLLFGRSRKSRMNYFITHLAFADLSVGLINVLTDIVWRITVLVTYGSTYVLVALSIDRYDAITHPMKFSGSWKRAKCLIIAAWLFSVLFSIPILILYEEKLIQNQLQCWIEFEHQWQWKTYMVLVSVTLFIVPALIITTCYAVIIVTIWAKGTPSFARNRRTEHDRPGSDNSRRASSRGLIPRAKVKTVKITFVIVTVFILCWSPYIIFDLLQVYGHIPKTQTNIAVSTFVQSLAPLNSAANPIIYCIFSTHFCKMIGNAPASHRIFSRCCCSLLPPFKWFCRRKKRKTGESTTTTTTTTTTAAQASNLLSEFLTNTQKRRSEVVGTATKAHTVLIHAKN